MSADFRALQNLMQGRPRNFGERMRPYVLPQTVAPVAPPDSVLEEQVAGFGVRWLAPGLLPVYQGMEMPEDSPNISPRS